MPQLEFEARNYRQSKGRMYAMVIASLDGAPIHGDTVQLDDAQSLAAFETAVRSCLNGHQALADDMQARLHETITSVRPKMLDLYRMAEAALAEGEGRTSQADKLVELALDAGAQPFHDPQDETYLRVPVADHVECWPLRSVGCRDWLRRGFWQRHGKAPNGEALQSALGVLEGQARFDGPTDAVHVRVAADGNGGLFVDLGDVAWRAIHCTPRGWQLVAQPPVCFRRASGMLALPAPERGGRLDDLRAFVNVASDEDWALLAAWLTAALWDRGPFPLLALYGQQGTAKTTTARLLRALVDPAKPDLRADPHEVRDVAIAARNAWIVALDNVSHIAPWLSDVLCRLSTGGGWAKRTNYSDLDETLFDARRPVMLTGICEFIGRGDLLDRALTLTLPVIAPKQRRREQELWAVFERERPRLLGALLDSVCGALREEPRVRLPELPRMADFATYAVAAERGRGEPPRFLQAYGAQRAQADEQAAEASAIGSLLLAWLPGETALGPWTGTAEALLDALNAQATEAQKRGKQWPKSGRGMRAEMTRLAPHLRGLGYLVEFGQRAGHGSLRMIVISAQPPDNTPPRQTPPHPPGEKVGIQPSASSASSATPRFADDCAETVADDVADDLAQQPSAVPAISPASPAGADDVRSAPTVADDVVFETVGTRAGVTTRETPTADDADDLIPMNSERLITPYTLLTTTADVQAALPTLLTALALGLDSETTGLDPRRHRLRLVQFATPEHVYILDAFRADVRLLAPVFAQAPRLVGHNLKFDLHFLAAAGLPMPEGARLFDTMLAAQLLDAAAGGAPLKYNLAAVADRYLGETVDKTEQTSNWAAATLTPEQVAYAAKDAAILLPLAERLDAELTAANLQATAALEMRALPAIVWLEQTGAPFDGDAWQALSDAAVYEKFRLEDTLTEATGTGDMFGKSTVNWSSPDQVLRLLQERGHNIQHTDEASLLPLVEADPVIKLLLEHREASRKANVYGIEWLQKHAHPTTGRIHADYFQLGSRAGRMSCQRPNLQQVPRDKAYRACFRPAPGRVLVKADYSQIELRIAAELTGDKRLLAAYRTGEDVHTVTAAAVLGAQDGVTPSQRQAAKALNFGLLYGMGAKTLREHAATNYGVVLTQQEAEDFRAGFFRTYTGLQAWHRRQPPDPVDTRTVGGRRRLGVQRFTEKLNTPVQGTGADGLKAALALLWETRHECPSAVPVFCVHDEIVLEVDEADAEMAKAWLARYMVQGMQQFLKRVPVVVEATIGQDWSMC